MRMRPVKQRPGKRAREKGLRSEGPVFVPVAMPPGSRDEAEGERPRADTMN